MDVREEKLLDLDGESRSADSIRTGQCDVAADNRGSGGIGCRQGKA